MNLQPGMLVRGWHDWDRRQIDMGIFELIAKTPCYEMRGFEEWECCLIKEGQSWNRLAPVVKAGLKRKNSNAYFHPDDIIGIVKNIKREDDHGNLL